LNTLKSNSLFKTIKSPGVTPRQCPSTDLRKYKTTKIFENIKLELALIIGYQSDIRTVKCTL